MRKAQGALEYLIIIAAVLAIAAIVVLFLTSAYKATGGDLQKCRLSATTCKTSMDTGTYRSYSTCIPGCISACADAAGFDVLNATIKVTQASCVRGTTGAYGCAYCSEGNVTLVQK